MVPKTYLALECREPFSSARPTQAQGARDWTRCPDLSLPSHLCNLRGPGSGHSTSSQDIPEPPDPVRFLPDAPLFFPGRSALCWRCRAEPTSEETPAAALGILGRAVPAGAPAGSGWVSPGGAPGVCDGLVSLDLQSVPFHFPTSEKRRVGRTFSLGQRKVLKLGTPTHH